VTNPRGGKRWDILFLASLFTIPANMACQFAATWLSTLRPLRLDYYLLQMDGWSGMQPSFAIGRLLEHHRILNLSAITAYNALPVAVLVVFMAHLISGRESAALLLKVFTINLFAALPIYLLLPVVGPRHAFPGFPDALPLVASHAAAFPGIINGIPSVHFSTALFVFWFARHWALGRIASAAYLVLIFTATLGSGEHYLFDRRPAVFSGRILDG